MLCPFYSVHFALIENKMIGGIIMNAVEIKKMLNNIKADFIGIGRPWHENDDSVIELLMSVYYQTAEIDWEEIKWLFINYLQKGIIDFPKAKKMAQIRIA